MQPGSTGDSAPAALYIRSMPGDPDDSLEVQLRVLQGHAARNGLEQVRVFFDARDSRTQFERMMAEATGDNPSFRRILVVELRRLAGDSGESEALLAGLKASGVTVQSVSGSSEGIQRPNRRRRRQRDPGDRGQSARGVTGPPV